ncbi:hypothetical protein FKM82_004835 [Ascaphus truei]
MASLRAVKQALRLELKQRVSALGSSEKLRQSQVVTRKVLTHSRYVTAKRVALFLSMPDEVQTAGIIHDIFQQGKECFIPRYRPRSNHMDMVRLNSVEEISQLPVTTWNISQPAEGDCREEALSTEHRHYITVCSPFTNPYRGTGSRSGTWTGIRQGRSPFGKGERLLRYFSGALQPAAC